MTQLLSFIWDEGSTDPALGQASCFMLRNTPSYARDIPTNPITVTAPHHPSFPPTDIPPYHITIIET
jgi:hypothetical protein